MIVTASNASISKTTARTVYPILIMIPARSLFTGEFCHEILRERSPDNNEFPFQSNTHMQKVNVKMYKNCSRLEFQHKSLECIRLTSRKKRRSLISRDIFRGAKRLLITILIFNIPLITCIAAAGTRTFLCPIAGPRGCQSFVERISKATSLPVNKPHPWNCQGIEHYQISFVLPG